MDNSALSHGPERVLPFWRRRRQGQEAKKTFWSLVPRNPLISLDSDERIEGNPRKYNP